MSWPGKSLIAWIGLKNVGLPARQWPEIFKIKTVLGLNELGVDWHEKGGVLRGEIPPQAGPGPWVIRVSVEDMAGHLIARNFYEVSRRKKKLSNKSAN